MKNFTSSCTAILITLILTISIIGCGQQQSPPQTSTTTETSSTPTNANKTYTDTENGFSVEYPSDWNVKANLSDFQKNTGVVAIFEGPSSPKYDSRVSIQIEAEDIGGEATAEEYAAGVEKAILKKNISNYTNIQEEITTVSGLHAVKRVFTGTATSAAWKFTQTYFTKGRIGYVITYQATTDIYDNYYNAYNLALNSFTLN